MLLNDIVKLFDEFEIHQRRTTNDNYCELVFYTKDTDKWSDFFTSQLGQPIKPHGSKPSKDDELIAKDYGGIYDDQTLFKKEVESSIVIAMFWPWQDGINTTLKLAVLSKDV